MKLIDADLLIDMFKNDIAKTEHYINTSQYVSDETKKRYKKIIKIFEEYIEIIEHLPVAYDVDKVLKKISERNREYQEKYREYQKEGCEMSEEIFYQKAKTMAETYDIVKAGGLNDNR